MTKWASPTIDLSYVLYLSATPELRQAHETELLEYYHQALTQALKELGEDPSVFTIRYQVNTLTLFPSNDVNFHVNVNNKIPFKAVTSTVQKARFLKSKLSNLLRLCTQSKK